LLMKGRWFLLGLVLVVFASMLFPSGAHSSASEHGTAGDSRNNLLLLRSDTARFWLPDTLETGWLASDKKLHLLACYSIVLTGDAAADRLETGVICAVALSMGKELWDLWFKTPVSHRGVSTGDLIADAVGIGAGIFVVQAFGE